MILCKEENSDLPEMFVAMPFHIFFEFRCPLQKKSFKISSCLSQLLRVRKKQEDL